MVLARAKLEKKPAIEILKEYRDFGSTLSHTFAAGTCDAVIADARRKNPKITEEELNKECQKVKDHLANGQNYIPTDWLNESLKTPIILDKDSRAVHRHGNPATIKLSGKNMDDTDAVHELGHRMQAIMTDLARIDKTRTDITRIEGDFHKRRTTKPNAEGIDVQEKAIPIHTIEGHAHYNPFLWKPPGTKDDIEWVRRDEFIDPYMGKLNPSGRFETLPMGLERLQNGKIGYGDDNDFDSFILGLLLHDKKQTEV